MTQQMIQPLEARSYFAGNVQVSISDLTGHVDIVGDAADNHIVIYKSRIGGVDGMTVGGVDGTTINGKAYAKVIESSGVAVAMGDGADNVDISGPEFSRLAVNMGTGNDTLKISSVYCRGRCDLYGGAGNDVITATSTVFNDHVRIVPGAGADRVGLRKVYTHEGFEISDEGPHSEISLVRVVDTYDSHIQRSYIGTSGGNDTLRITDSTFKEFKACLRGGDDTAVVRGSSYTTVNPIDGGSGNNTVDLGQLLL